MRDKNSKKSEVFSLMPINYFVFLFILDLWKPLIDFCNCCFVKISWSKKMVRKWFNIKSKTEEFQADDVYEGLCLSFVYS